jgi:hypothetical protein
MTEYRERVPMHKKALWWIAIVLFIVWLASDPRDAAQVLADVGSWIRGAGKSLVAFFDSLSR